MISCNWVFAVGVSGAGGVFNIGVLDFGAIGWCYPDMGHVLEALWGLDAEFGEGFGDVVRH